MKVVRQRIWKEQTGVRIFAGILLIAVAVIGIAGGVSPVRGALLRELDDLAEAIVALDQSDLIVHPVEASARDKFCK